MNKWGSFDPNNRSLLVKVFYVTQETAFQHKVSTFKEYLRRTR